MFDINKVAIALINHYNPVLGHPVITDLSEVDHWRAGAALSHARAAVPVLEGLAETGRLDLVEKALAGDIRVTTDSVKEIASITIADEVFVRDHAFIPGWAFHPT